MALTKHQKLARGLQSFLDSMDSFFKQTATFVDSLQFHFYETHWIIGRSHITKETLRRMMYTHRYAMSILAQDENLKKTCQTKPLIGCVFWPKLYPASKVIKSAEGVATDDPWFIPWRVKINLPDKTLKDLDDAFLEAILYCASPDEAPDWIDWFEKENKAGSLTNLLLSLIADEEMLRPLKENLKKPALIRKLGWHSECILNQAKPKWMHWSTFIGIRNEIEFLHNEAFRFSPFKNV